MNIKKHRDLAYYVQDNFVVFFRVSKNDVTMSKHYTPNLSDLYRLDCLSSIYKTNMQMTTPGTLIINIEGIIGW